MSFKENACRRISGLARLLTECQAQVRSVANKKWILDKQKAVYGFNSCHVKCYVTMRFLMVLFLCLVLVEQKALGNLSIG